MKKIKRIFTLLVIFQAVIACRSSDEPHPAAPKKVIVELKQSNVDLGTHKLAAFSMIRNSKYLVVFEAGLGDDHSIWNTNNVALKIADSIDIVTYDRASHGQSQRGPDPRDINRLQSELTYIVDVFAKGRKVVLIGHSLGGFIIKDWAIKNPTRIAGLLFVDPSVAVLGSTMTQADQDAFYNSWVASNGLTNGCTLEAKELKNDVEYMATSGNLPNVPVIVLTCLKLDGTYTADDQQAHFNYQASLGIGVSDFTQVARPNSGHMMMIDDPKTLIEYIQVLLATLD